MFHFRGNPTCSARTSDTKAICSVAPDLETFRDCQIVNAHYCAECAGIRSDSERYAELRKLVEAYQSAKSYDDDVPLQALRDWSHR